jgi:ligand-binding sensor domain-containing protein/two-component sensor histidine kinase
MKHLLPFLLCLLLIPNVQAQKYSFVTYSTEEGLPQTQVTSLCQDSAGYLWIGTLGGLAKFNGSEFKTYSSNDGLINNRVHTLSYFENTLWVGHDGGISLVTPTSVSHIAFKGNDKSRKVSDIIRFNEHLLVSTDGGGLFRLENSELKRIDLPTLEFERIRDSYVHDDKLYLVTRGGVLTSTDAKNFKHFKGLGDHSYSGVDGNDDYILFTSFNHGAFKLDISTGKITEINDEKLKYQLFGCYIDSKGDAWMNTENGIVRLFKNNSISFLSESNGLPLNVISCFYEDFEKNVWIGSEGKGVFRFPGSLFKYYDQSTGYPSELFVSGFQKSNGDFLLGSYDKGLIRKRKDGVIETIEVNNNTIWVALEGVDGKDWFGTQSSLVSIDNSGNIKEYDISDGLPGRKITALYRIDAKSMYVGGGEGASVYRNGEFRRLGRPDDEFIGTVRDFEFLNGELYCVTNLGMFRYEGGSFVQVENTERVVYNLEKDEHGNLWFGTEEGLFRWTNGKMERIDLYPDPASNYINLINRKGNSLYVGSNNGLFVLNDLNAKVPSVKRYGKGDGVVDLETNLNSGFFDQSGSFWFGTASGLICFHPKTVSTSTSNPTLHIKEILLNYQQFDYNLYSDDVTTSGLPVKLVLPYSKNNLMVELDGVSLIYHDGLQYQFMLEGLSETWSPLTEVPTITFTSLPAGDYSLRIRAVDLEGRYSEETILPFRIKQAFYKTWWFIGLCIVFTGLIVIAIFRMRLRRIRETNEKEKLEYKTRLLALEQKSVNASMNRHFIFNALNSIQYFINTQDRLSANKYLTNFAQLIRKNLDSATSDNNTITLDEELARIKLYLSLEAMRFKDRFEYNINVHDVDTESILIPSMIMQPFVENSIIHGILPNEKVKGQINIDISQDNDFLSIVIEDNGIGVNQSMKGKSEIDVDHKSQGMEITSKRIELLQKITQNNISMEGPYEITDDNGLIKGTRVLIKIPTDNLDF